MDREPKTISESIEQAMKKHAESDIEILVDEYPDAREIDVLNAYLRAFKSLTTEAPMDWRANTTSSLSVLFQGKHRMWRRLSGPPK